uniref:Uncharacterized protein n=1 Tax=Nelumbo nucifera TaxID=4432 RepID=A0A822YQ87_NELNU|nr:TPA_asm: hypothetical protein HUJ06_005402 [Nelumbo nucifera]
MIAAIVNLLDYDVYDLELTAVKSNTHLRNLLVETTSKTGKRIRVVLAIILIRDCLIVSVRNLVVIQLLHSDTSFLYLFLYFG